MNLRPRKRKKIPKEHMSIMELTDRVDAIISSKPHMMAVFDIANFRPSTPIRWGKRGLAIQTLFVVHFLEQHYWLSVVNVENCEAWQFDDIGDLKDFDHVQ